MDALVTLDPGSDRQRSAARALTQLGQGTEALAAELTFLLAGDETSELSPGLEIDDAMKWLLLISLASLGRMDAARLADELSISHTATNELYYRTAIAALPDLKRHSTLWTQIYDGVDSQGAALTNAQVTASARGLAVHPDFLRELFPKLLNGLQTIWTSRSNNLATRTINGFVPMNLKPTTGGPNAQAKHPSLVQLDAWLAQHPDAPSALRRLLVERRADLAHRLIAQATTRRS